MSKLIVGCGYVGGRLADFWNGLGEDVYVTTRSHARGVKFRDRGLKPIVLDVTDVGDVKLPDVETLVFAVGFDRTAEHSVRDVYVEGLRNVLRACPDTVQRLIYLSSTGVYGQTNGDWIDEQSTCRPNRDSGKACLAAEELLQHDPMFSSRTCILRLAGIYGPRRLPQAEFLRRGQPLQVTEHAYLNLVHVDDIIRIIATCEKQTMAPTILCVSDGHPVMRGAFYRYLATLIGAAVPIFEPPLAGTARAERARGSKRIRNDRLAALLTEAELTPTFIHPSYREGLAAIVEAAS